MTELVDPESVGFSSRRLNRVSQWLEDQIASQRLAGAGVLIGRHGKRAFFETTGMADIETQNPFGRDTVVRIYSMTKPITTVAAMMLYEEGCFQLDDPIEKYLPEFAKIRVWRGDGADIGQTDAADTSITVKQIMTHTSGLTYGFMNATPVDAAYRERGIEFPGASGELRTWVNSLAQVPLLSQPGAEWNYSVSTDVLGRLVEVWSGEDLRSFLGRRVFEPLGMVDTDFHVRTENHHRFATLYGPLGGGDLGNVGRTTKSGNSADRPTGLVVQDPAVDSRFLQPATLYSGGGGLVGTMSDYARFCQMLLNNGELDGTRLLSRTTVSHMRLNHLPDGCDGPAGLERDQLQRNRIRSWVCGRA